MINKMEAKKELIRRLEIRKKQLMASPEKRKYRLHEGHYLRDVFTMLAFLKKDKLTDQLIQNLPTENDLPIGDT